MQRRGIYYVLMLALVLPSCAFAAGWTAAAWDFTNRSWSATNGIATNPMYAVHTIDVITQGSTTNIIPAIDKSGYSFRGWTTEELTELEAINGFGEALLVYTSEYDNAHHPFDYRIEDIYSNATVFSATNVFVVDGGTNELITEISRTYSGTVVQVSMDVDTLRDYEMYMAMWERARAIGSGSSISVALGVDWSATGAGNLENIKRWISTNATNYLNTTNSEATTNSVFDYSGVYDTPQTNGYYKTNSPAVWTISNLCLACSMPTNYFNPMPNVSTNLPYLEYTPYKFMVPVGYEYGEAVTTTAKIIRYPASKWIQSNSFWFVTNGSSNIVVEYTTNFVYTYDQDEEITNTIFKYDGTITNLVGTNNQVVSCVTTQKYIMSGYTEWDYGYRYITNLFSKLVNIYGTASWSSTGILTKYTQDGTRREIYSSYSAMYGDTDYNDTNYFEKYSETNSYAAGMTKYCGNYEWESGVEFNQFGETYFYDNSIMHITQTNISKSLFVPFDANYYAAMAIPNIVTSIVESHLSYSSTPPNSVVYTYDQAVSVITNNPVFSLSPSTYRGYAGTFNFYDSGITGNSEIVYGSVLTSALSDDFDINPKISVGVLNYGTSDTYQISISDAAIPENTKSSLLFDSEGRSIFRHSDAQDLGDVFIIQPIYTPIMIRNYAVTNGFKYY